MTTLTERPALTSPPPAQALPTDPYRPAVRRLLPGMRRSFLTVNRYVAGPLLRAGFGPLLSTPLAGSLMLLRTRGRRSGAWREAPLGYVIRDGSVYCCAGFGPTTHWLRNAAADPRVEVLLPGRSLTGIAEVVTDPAERVAALRELLGSMSLISRPLVGDLASLPDAEVDALSAATPVVRIRATGLAAGPWDPGGSGWIVPTALWLLAAGVVLRRAVRSLADRRLRRMSRGPT
jgi:deazaflavin-dependent oxidoreductase (nitroreductase family)